MDRHSQPRAQPEPSMKQASGRRRLLLVQKWLSRHEENHQEAGWVQVMKGTELSAAALEYLNKHQMSLFKGQGRGRRKTQRKT